MSRAPLASAPRPGFLCPQEGDRPRVEQEKWTMNRIDTLRRLLEADPDDPFPRYALGLEHLSRGELEPAGEMLEEVLQRHPDYLPAYYQLGKVYEERGDFERARKTWERGVELAIRQGDEHTREELQGALDTL